MKFISAQFRQVSRQEASHHRLSHIVISSPHPLLSFSPMVFASCIIYCKICLNLSWIFSGVYRYQEVLNGYMKITSYHNIPKRGLRNLNSHKFDFFLPQNNTSARTPKHLKSPKKWLKNRQKIGVSILQMVVSESAVPPATCAARYRRRHCQLGAGVASSLHRRPSRARGEALGWALNNESSRSKINQ